MLDERKLAFNEGLIEGEAKGRTETLKNAACCIRNERLSNPRGHCTTTESVSGTGLKNSRTGRLNLESSEEYGGSFDEATSIFIGLLAFSYGSSKLRFCPPFYSIYFIWAVEKA